MRGLAIATAIQLASDFGPALIIDLGDSTTQIDSIRFQLESLNHHQIEFNSSDKGEYFERWTIKVRACSNQDFHGFGEPKARKSITRVYRPESKEVEIDHRENEAELWFLLDQGWEDECRSYCCRLGASRSRLIRQSRRHLKTSAEQDLIAIRLSPDDPRCHFSLAGTYFRLADADKENNVDWWELASQKYEHGFNTEPDNSYWHEYAKCFYEMMRALSDPEARKQAFDKGLAVLDRGIEAYPAYSLFNLKGWHLKKYDCKNWHGCSLNILRKKN